MKTFQKFLEEVDIKGNPAIPGEGGKKENEPTYLSDVERRAKQRLGITAQDRPTMTPMGPMPSRKEMQLVGELMGQPGRIGLLQKAMQLTNGYERELSELATTIIYDIYKDIIDRYEIELDIKLVRPGQIKQFMDDCEECEQEEPPKMREITDPNVIKEIHKRKIANLVIQGEAKNTKHILHSEEVKDGLNQILGETRGKELFNTLDRISKIADQLDWLADPEIRSQMLEEHPEGLAGACKVDWKPKDKKEDEEDQKKNLSYEEDDIEDNEDEPTERFDKTPILRARGVDFSMLLHEAVKGLFEILSLAGLPVVRDEEGEEDQEKTKELLKKVYANTGLSDEPQDWQYGPEIAADLRDFVNKNEKVDLYTNVREELWKLMLDRETMPTDEFLDLMRGILAKTDRARTKVDALITKVINTIKAEKEADDQYRREMEEYERNLKEWEEGKKEREMATEEEPEDEVDKLVKKSLSKEPKETDDYSTWSQREIQNEIDNALDSGDYEKVKELSKFLKEGREIYLRELQIINEKLNLHTK